VSATDIFWELYSCIQYIFSS